jgi:DNA-binding NarL/FixJ family response regulator
MTAKILIVDDHQIFREGLRALLSNQPDVQVLAEAEDGRKALRLCQELRPDLVIMDVGLPDLNGIEATRQITSMISGIKVIGLSMHADRRFVVEMLKAGASGYLLKDCAFLELKQALKAVMNQRAYLSPEIAHVVLQDYTRLFPRTKISAFSLLSSREREVLQLLAEGKSTRQIASALHLSVKTIETHRQHLMEKLNLHTLAGLIKYAVREGITSLET